MLIASQGLLNSNANPSEAQIRDAIAETSAAAPATSRLSSGAARRRAHGEGSEMSALGQAAAFSPPWIRRGGAKRRGGLSGAPTTRPACGGTPPRGEGKTLRAMTSFVTSARSAARRSIRVSSRRGRFVADVALRG